MGDRQVEGIQNDASNMYDPVLKAVTVPRFTAISAQRGAKTYRSATIQAFL